MSSKRTRAIRAIMAETGLRYMAAARENGRAGNAAEEEPDPVPGPDGTSGSGPEEKNGAEP